MPDVLVRPGAARFGDGASVRRLTPHMLDVEEADHAMALPGPVGDSVAVLGRVVEEFLEAIEWPS